MAACPPPPLATKHDAPRGCSRRTPIRAHTAVSRLSELEFARLTARERPSWAWNSGEPCEPLIDASMRKIAE